MTSATYTSSLKIGNFSGNDITISWFGAGSVSPELQMATFYSNSVTNLQSPVLYYINDSSQLPEFLPLFIQTQNGESGGGRYPLQPVVLSATDASISLPSIIQGWSIMGFGPGVLGGESNLNVFNIKSTGPSVGNAPGNGGVSDSEYGCSGLCSGLEFNTNTPDTSIDMIGLHAYPVGNLLNASTLLNGGSNVSDSSDTSKNVVVSPLPIVTTVSEIPSNEYPSIMNLYQQYLDLASDIGVSPGKGSLYNELAMLGDQGYLLTPNAQIELDDKIAVLIPKLQTWYENAVANLPDDAIKIFAIVLVSIIIAIQKYVQMNNPNWKTNLQNKWQALISSLDGTITEDGELLLAAGLVSGIVVSRTFIKKRRQAVKTYLGGIIQGPGSTIVPPLGVGPVKLGPFIPIPVPSTRKNGWILPAIYYNHKETQDSWMFGSIALMMLLFIFIVIIIIAMLAGADMPSSCGKYSAYIIPLAPEV